MKHNILTVVTLFLLVLCGFAFWETGYVEFVLGAFGILYVGFVIYGSFQIRANYFLSSIHKGKKKSVSLTFDDGPDPANTPAILDILKEKNISATFFVIGKKAEQHPELVERIYAEGHTLGNHSYSHSRFLGFFSQSRLHHELVRSNEVIESITGQKPIFFRPPFGVTNPRYARVLKDLKMKSIGWSLRSFDTRAKNKYQLIERIVVSLKKSDIILLHDNLTVTAEALEDIIEHCRNKKLDIQPLPGNINLEPYEKI